MIYTLTKDQVEEMALCIVHNDLNDDEACEYALKMAFECTSGVGNIDEPVTIDMGKTR